MMIVRLEPRGDGKRVIVVADSGEVVREYDVTSTLPENVGVQICGESESREAIVAACDRAFGTPEFVAGEKEGCPCGKKPASACDGHQCQVSSWLTNPRPGLKIRTKSKLQETDGMMIAPKHLAQRRPDMPGVILDHVPGHGGDVWYVKHPGELGEVAAVYSVAEMLEERS